MPQYRRAFIPGGTYAFTVVTCNRIPWLTSEDARRILRNVWSEVNRQRPFTTVAVCLLPEHLHCIWTLPEGDAGYPMRWHEIKRRFTREYLRQVGPAEPRSASRVRHGEAAVWQRRYWEHTIKDEEDLRRQIDYIHYNPVKHGLARCAADWPWSSFHRYVREGVYAPDWGEGLEMRFNATAYGE